MYRHVPTHQGRFCCYGKQQQQQQQLHQSKFVFNCQVQALQTQKLIKDQFEQLHEVLYQEESKRIAAVKREEEARITGMKDKIKELSAETQILRETISVIQDQLKEDNILLLKVCTMKNQVKKQHILNDYLQKQRYCFLSFDRILKTLKTGRPAKLLLSIGLDSTVF